MMWSTIIITEYQRIGCCSPLGAGCCTYVPGQTYMNELTACKNNLWIVSYILDLWNYSTEAVLFLNGAGSSPGTHHTDDEWVEPK